MNTVIWNKNDITVNGVLVFTRPDGMSDDDFIAVVQTYYAPHLALSAEVEDCKPCHKPKHSVPVQIRRRRR